MQVAELTPVGALACEPERPSCPEHGPMRVHETRERAHGTLVRYQCDTCRRRVAVPVHKFDAARRRVRGHPQESDTVKAAITVVERQVPADPESRLMFAVWVQAVRDLVGGDANLRREAGERLRGRFWTLEAIGIDSDWAREVLQAALYAPVHWSENGTRGAE